MRRPALPRRNRTGADLVLPRLLERAVVEKAALRGVQDHAALEQDREPAVVALAIGLPLMIAGVCVSQARSVRKLPKRLFS